jgi:hypothetical protein
VLDQSLTRWQLLGVALALGSLVAAQRTSTRYAPASRGSTSPMPTPSVRSATDLGLRGRPALDT